jgi:hypothetical protein
VKTDVIHANPQQKCNLLLKNYAKKFFLNEERCNGVIVPIMVNFGSVCNDFGYRAPAFDSFYFLICVLFSY